MMAFWLFLSFACAGAALINVPGEIRRDPDTPGWVFGIGLLLCVVFFFLAIRTGA